MPLDKQSQEDHSQGTHDSKVLIGKQEEDKQLPRQKQPAGGFKEVTAETCQTYFVVHCGGELAYWNTYVPGK